VTVKMTTLGYGVYCIFL